MQKRTLDYQGVYGFYWYFEDELSKLAENPAVKPGFTVIKKETQFRKDHMDVKLLLLESKNSKGDQNVSREQLFPFYANRTEQAKKQKELKKPSKSNEEIQKLNEEIDGLKQNLNKLGHEDIYEKIFEFLMQGKMDEFKDAFSQMQHEYKQDVSGDKKQLEKLAREYETKKLEAQKKLDKDQRE